MEQEYYMWTPNPKAKLFKRYTYETPVELENADSITIEDNKYVCHKKFKWVDTETEESGDEQPIDGLIVSNSYRTIRTNSRYNFEKGDIVMLPDGSRWIISDDVPIGYIYSPKKVQTYQYLSLAIVG